MQKQCSDRGRVIIVDAESLIFTAVATILRTQYPGIFIMGEYAPVPSTFPAVMLIEVDNSIFGRTKDLAGRENNSILMYEANVFTNLSSGKKAQAKSIMALIDDKMQEIGFARVGCGPTEMPNADKSIYRMTARYRAVINHNKGIQKII